MMMRQNTAIAVPKHTKPRTFTLITLSVKEYYVCYTQRANIPYFLGDVKGAACPLAIKYQKYFERHIQLYLNLFFERLYRDVVQ